MFQIVGAFGDVGHESQLRARSGGRASFIQKQKSRRDVTHCYRHPPKSNLAQTRSVRPVARLDQKQENSPNPVPSPNSVLPKSCSRCNTAESARCMGFLTRRPPSTLPKKERTKKQKKGEKKRTNKPGKGEKERTEKEKRES